MFLAAILVGLLTAYYLGVRAGIVAAATAAGLFLLAALMPPLKLIAYALVAVGVAGVCLVGPHHQRPETKEQVKDLLKWGRRAFGYLKRKV
jgi:hypothetical protein